MPVDNLSEMTPHRAVCLALMALDDVAERAPDVADWSQAAAVIRALLAELRGPAPDWFFSRGRYTGRGGRHRSEY